MATAFRMAPAPPRWRRAVGSPLGSPMTSTPASPVVGSLWGPTTPRKHPQPHPRPGTAPVGPPTPTETDEEYVELYQDRILEAQASQLYPLMEDLADWLNKTLCEYPLAAFTFVHVCSASTRGGVSRSRAPGKRVS